MDIHTPDEPLLFDFADTPQPSPAAAPQPQRNPFDHRRVAPIGLFSIAHIKERLITMGAETYPAGTQKAGKLNDDISGNTHYIILGKCPSARKREKMEEVIYKGWAVRILTEADFLRICDGEYDGYWTDEVVPKDLTFTIDHFTSNRLPIYDTLVSRDYTTGETAMSFNMENPVLEDDIYIPDNVSGDVGILSQIIGNIGAYANREIESASESDKSVPIIMLSDETIDRLRRGERDATVHYIEQAYNKSAARYLIYRFVAESDLLRWAEQRCGHCGDDLTLSLIRRYRAAHEG